jgi:hypothetical protein
MPKETGKALVAKKQQKKELIFAGASHLLGVDPKRLSQQEVMAHKARVVVAQALGVPITAVVIMGNQPYVTITAGSGRRLSMPPDTSSSTSTFRSPRTTP